MWERLAGAEYEYALGSQYRFAKKLRDLVPDNNDAEPAPDAEDSSSSSMENENVDVQAVRVQRHRASKAVEKYEETFKELYDLPSFSFGEEFRQILEQLTTTKTPESARDAIAALCACWEKNDHAQNVADLAKNDPLCVGAWCTGGGHEKVLGNVVYRRTRVIAGASIEFVNRQKLADLLLLHHRTPVFKTHL